MRQLAFDFSAPVAAVIPDPRTIRGARNERAGRAAEDSVLRTYLREGHAIAATRWRGRCGELDLILRGPDGIVVVEIKSARTHDLAAMRLGPRQRDRILNATAEFLAGEPRGQLTDVRIDLALVAGDGQVKVIENALWDA